MMLLNPYRFATGGGTPQPVFSNVKLLMYGEGVNGAQTYTDSSSYARSITGGAAATVSTSQAYRGGASLSITGDINVSVPASTTDEWARMGTDAHPLTLEIAVRGVASAPTGFLAGNDGFGTPYWWGLRIAGVGTGIQMLESGPSVSATVGFVSTLASDTWYALAIAMRGTTHREIGVWLNGVWQGSATSAQTPLITASGSSALNVSRTGGGSQFFGFIDEFRISEELFLPWGADYTLATGAFPDS